MRGTALILKLIVCCLFLFIFNQSQGDFAYSSEQEDCPDIQFKERVYDFGTADQEDKIVRNFKFKNAGKGLLTVKSVKSCCGCIASLVSSKEIPPGKAGAIEVTFETRKYMGTQVKTVYVYSNDPDEPEIELVIRGVVVPEVELVPEALNFVYVEKGESVTRTLELIQVGKKRLRLKKVEAPEEYFLTRASDFKEGARHGLKVDVVLKPGAPVGQFEEVITLHTNLRKRRRIDVPVRGNIVGRIRVKPSVVSFGMQKKGSLGARKVEIKSVDQAEFNLLKVTSEPSFILARVRPPKSSGTFSVILRIDENAPAGKLRGEIAIHTDDPDQPVIKVPVHGLIAE